MLEGLCFFVYIYLVRRRLPVYSLHILAVSVNRSLTIHELFILQKGNPFNITGSVASIDAGTSTIH